MTYGKTLPLFSALLFGSLLLAGCGGGSPFTATSTSTSPIALTVNSMTPSSGPANTSTAVEIVGSGFDSTSVVYFGNIKVAPSKISATTLNLATPLLSAGNVAVSVVRSDGAKAQVPVNFTFTTAVKPLAPLTATAITPSAGPADTATSVQILGTGFDSTTVVYFGSLKVTPSSVSSTTLTASTPLESAGNVSVSVVRGDGATAQVPVNFTFTTAVKPLAPLTASAIAPSTGPADTATRVQIQGTGFDSTTVVYFGSLKVTPSSVSSTTLTVSTPIEAAGKVGVSLVRGDGATAQVPVNFTFTTAVNPLAPLTARAIAPSTGPAETATSVQIQGTGFDSTTVVYFGSLKAAPSSVSSTTLTVSTPIEAAGNVGVSLVRGDGAKAQVPGSFSFTTTSNPPSPLTASAMTPSTGPADSATAVQIQGSGFDSTTVVYFGSLKAIPGKISATSLSVNTPIEGAGNVGVSVVRGDGAKAQVPVSFSFMAASGGGPVPLVASSITPDTGVVNGNTPVQITGAGFDSTVAVLFGTVTVKPTSISSTTVTVYSPRENVGDVPVYVTRGDGQKAQAPGDYAYTDPLQVQNTGLPTGTSGSPYAATLSASSGVPPYTWTLTQGKLPTGVSLSTPGSIAGTPSSSGTFGFSAEVVDQAGGKVTVPLTLKVSTASGSGTAITAPETITGPGTYYLAQDLDCPGTCISLNGSGIVLNLNGHTLTYGTAPGGAVGSVYGIENDACWDTTHQATANPCDSQGTSAEIYGGSIVQSTNAPDFSHALFFGENNGDGAINLHNLTITIQQPGTQAIAGTYLPGGTQITYNTIYDNVTVINHPGQSDLSARSAFQGQAIYLQGQENNPSPTGDTISYNKIVGGPQGGIRTVDQNSTINNNDISQNALYSNDWCVEISADHTTANNNNCHPTSGRGINIDASYVTLQGNTIATTELPQNAEYNGCELDGAVGVRVESMYLGTYHPIPQGVNVSGNTITVTSNACSAFGFDLVYLESNAQISISGNTITTTNTGQSFDAAFAPDDTDGTGLTITGNTIHSMTQYVYGNWDGYRNFTIGHNTWNGSPTYTFVADDGACSPGNGNPTDTCPVSATIVDPLPETVSCGSYSEAKVTINGTVTQCSSTQ